MTALALALFLAARPAVQAPFRGEVEGLAFQGHSTGVIATFAEGSKVAVGKAAVDACSPPVSGGEPARAGFVRTPAAKLAIVHPPEPVTARALLGLAVCLSKQHGVDEANAFFFPKADSGVEVEAVWRYKQGVRLDRAVLSFRDDPLYVRYARRTVSRSEYYAAQWLNHPLSELAKKLGLPGREALERHTALLWEGADAPADAGVALARVTVFLPTGAALEVLQEAEATKVSPSKLLGEALADGQNEKKADKEKAVDPDPREKERGLAIWLPRPVLATAETQGDADGESLSAIVSKAWQRRHDAKKKDKDAKK